MNHHDCKIFKRAGFTDCPFRRLRGHEDEEDEEEKQRRALEDAGERSLFDDLPLAIGRRNASRASGSNLSRFPVIAHGDPAMRRRLEQLAAFQREGLVPSIPRGVTQTPFVQRVLQTAEERSRGFRHMGPGIAAALAALAALEGLRRSQNIGSNPNLQQVRASEKRSAQGLRGLSKTLSPGQGGGARGRGGFLKQADRLFGGRILRKLDMTARFGGSGSDTFSETGF